MTNATPAETMTDAIRQALRWAILFLLILYCIPLVLIAYSCHSTGHFQTDDTILKIFAGFAASSDESVALLHRVLLPLMGIFAPLAFRDPRVKVLPYAVMVILIFGIALSLYLSAVFNAPTVRDALRPYGLFGPEGTPTQAQVDAAFNTGITQIKAFFNRVQESLAMYLLLLFGLKLDQATK